MKNVHASEWKTILGISLLTLNNVYMVSHHPVLHGPWSQSHRPIILLSFFLSRVGLSNPNRPLTGERFLDGSVYFWPSRLISEKCESRGRIKPRTYIFKSSRGSSWTMGGGGGIEQRNTYKAGLSLWATCKILTANSVLPLTAKTLRYRGARRIRLLTT